MEHTQGPWVIKEDRIVSEIAATTICEFRYRIYPPYQPDEISSNARLIAGAPELLLLVKTYLSDYPLGSSADKCREVLLKID